MNRKDSRQELFEAAWNANADRVIELIDREPALLDATDATRNTALLVALKRKQIELASELITRGANVFVVNHSDRWAMRLIVERGVLKRDQRESLVESAISAGVWDAEMFHAVWRRDHVAAKQVLSRNPGQESVHLADPDGPDGYHSMLPYCGLSPLHYAVLAGDKRMTRLLLESGAEVDAVPHAHPSDSRYTPLYHVPSGCGALAQMLVDFGANVRHTAFYLSAGSKAMREVVVANGGAYTPLLAALSLGKQSQAVEIARSDPSVIHDRIPGAYIDTPLHMAVQARMVDVIEALIDHGMNIDTKSSSGSTALSMASDLYCPLDIFQLLVENGADIHANGDAPLYGAVWQHAYRHHDYESVIRYLVQQGARLRGLYHCALAGNVPAAKLLLELGANVNETCDDGWPALDRGYTPLDYCTGIAGEWRCPKLAAMLRKLGALHASEMENSTPPS